MHRTTTLSRALLASLIVATAGTAQKTWVVDASRGAGYDFADLPLCEATAKDGDRILVRRGNYSPITTSKGLTILCDVGAGIRMPLNASFTVRNLPAASRFVLGGNLLFSDLNGIPTGPTILLENNQGAVHLGNVIVSPGRQRTSSLQVRGCAAVTLDTCLLVPGISVERSHLLATSGRILASQTPLHGPVGHGVDAFRSTVELADMIVSGSSGGAQIPAYSAVFAQECEVIVRGDSTSTFTGGRYDTATQAAALHGNQTSSMLVIDPTVTLSGGISAFRSVVQQRMPALSVTDGVLGGTARLDLYSEQADVFAVWIALPSMPYAVPPLGWSWVDLPSSFVVAVGQQATEHWNGNMPLPNLPALRGLALTFQALNANASRGWMLSNGVVTVLR